MIKIHHESVLPGAVMSLAEFEFCLLFEMHSNLDHASPAASSAL